MSDDATSRPPWHMRLRALFPAGQALRYLLVGGWNTVFGYSLFAGLTYVLTGRVAYAYVVAAVLANIVAITVAFLLYKYFVFRTRGDFWREYLRTYVVYGLSMVFGLGMLHGLVVISTHFFGPHPATPYVAQAMVLPLGIVLSFLGHRAYSFRDRD